MRKFVVKLHLTLVHPAHRWLKLGQYEEFVKLCVYISIFICFALASAAKQFKTHTRTKQLKQKRNKLQKAINSKAKIIK